ncbi:hypothetical protein F4553_002435 [Allocatelliglobosispora scoriae]|uniref:Uncharacterized protein n=1 Tax=Allocatelliglobosispora scoriae TaxID=643052 RepID=A0A841BP23_9ACTN|nr:hypothetical protein [Allocatelliglobosispora scoriae]MBB5869056.1 hypothetical protein [Allocatelliglobosispora scoriae]
MRVVKILVVAALGVTLATLIGTARPASSSIADFPRCCYPGGN